MNQVENRKYASGYSVNRYMFWYSSQNVRFRTFFYIHSVLQISSQSLRFSSTLYLAPQLASWPSLMQLSDISAYTCLTRIY